MSKKCPHCGTIVEDDTKYFCPNCSEPIDKDLNLIRDVDKAIGRYQDMPKNKHEEIKKPVEKPKKRYDDDDIEIKKFKQEKTNPLVIVIIIVFVVIAIILLYLATK